MVGRGAIISILLVALVQPAAGLWSQHGGGPTRDFGSDYADGPIDVLRVFDVHSPAEETFLLTGSPYVATPHGVAGIVRDRERATCAVVRVHVPDAAIERSAPWDCATTQLQGYDATNDQLLACTLGQAGQAAAVALDPATGAERWRTTALSVGAGADVEGTVWTCLLGVVDEERGLLVTPFIGLHEGSPASYTHRIAALSLADGQPVWSRIVPGYGGLAPLPAVAVPTLDNGEENVEGSGVNYIPQAITAADLGYVVAATRICADPARCGIGLGALGNEGSLLAPSLAWFDLDGTFVGERTDHAPAAEDPTGSEAFVPRASRTAASNGNLAVAVMLDRLAVINVAAREPLREFDVDVVEGPIAGTLRVGGPVWTGDSIYAPLHRSIVRFGASTGDLLATYPGEGGAWALPEVVATSGPELVAVSIRLIDEWAPERDRPMADRAAVVRLDSGDLSVLQRLFLPFTDRLVTDDILLRPDGQYGMAWLMGMQPVPVDERHLFVANGVGQAAILGPAQADLAPDFDVSTRFPRVGGALTLSFDAKEGAKDYHVAWGDGARESLSQASGRLAHQYAASGAQILLVTAEFPDGTTATKAVRVDVGGEPLNFMQVAFSDQYRDTTWGLIGIAIVLLGALFGLIAKWRGRGRIALGLTSLGAIRTEAEDDPVSALRHLQAWHRGHERDLLRGRLTEEQFQVLEGRAAHLLRKVARTVMAPFADAVTPGFGQRIEQAFLDGFVDPGEVRRLRQASRNERLDRQQRRALEGMLDALE